EQGPTTDVELQWATYYDAADQAGQSRIWGGIHILADDFADARMGSTIGANVFDKARTYWAPVASVTAVPSPTPTPVVSTTVVAATPTSTATGGTASPTPAPRPQVDFVLQNLPGALLSISGTSASDVYAVGADANDGTGAPMLHFDGERWQRRTPGP